MTDHLPNDVESLQALVKELMQKIAKLEAENAELRRRLGLNSTNSHQPPSSDGYRKKSVKPGLPKEEKKANGGQAGHQGDTLKRVEKPDHVIQHLPDRCRCCGRVFSASEARIEQSRQVFDLPEPKLEVTEHQIGVVSCCGLEHRGSYPTGVTGPVQYGSGVTALVTKRSGDHRMPLEQISQHFEDLYGYALNTATIESILTEAYERAEGIEQQVMAHLQQEGVVHFDETGIRVGGKLQWLHTASTERYSHWFIHEKRGTEALQSEASVLKTFPGTALHDCWSPYFTFDQLRHGLCGAHLLRELNGLMDNGSVWAEKMHGYLLELHGQPRPIADGEAVRQRYRLILAEADREEPPPIPGQRGRPKQSVGRNLMNRLRDYEDAVLAFALVPDIPFTNNPGERDLRPAKVKLKVSGCFRTPSGARVYARLQATISTFRKLAMNVMESLHDLLSGRTVVLE